MMQAAGSPLDHVTVTAIDLDRSRRIYDAALAPLGLHGVVDYVDPEDEDEAGVEAVGYAAEDARIVLWLVAGARPTANLHVALRAPDEGTVRAFFAAATGAGATVARRPRSGSTYRAGGAFSAMVADPDGNIIEASVDVDEVLDHRGRGEERA